MGVKQNRERVTGLEIYYTNEEVVDMCIGFAKPFIKDHHHLIDPCAGNGAFLDGFARAKLPNSVFGLDIAPQRSDIRQADALSYCFSQDHLFALTNPPFGRANSLSVKFFNRMAESCDYIGFIVPKSWRKWSIQNRLDLRFELLLDQEMPAEAFHAPDGSPHPDAGLRTVFQIWGRGKNLRKKVHVEDRRYFHKVPPQQADVAITAFGYKTGRIERKGVFVPEKNSTKLFLKVQDSRIIDALESVDVSRYSKNVAYTEVISMEELRSLLNDYFDNQ